MKNKLELTKFEKKLMDDYVSTWDYIEGLTGMLVVLRLKNGFNVYGSSTDGDVSKSGYGRHEALHTALANLDEFVDFEKHQKAFKHYSAIKEEEELNRKSQEMLESDMKKVGTSLFEKSKEVSGAEAHRMTDQEFRDGVIGKDKELHQVRAVSTNGKVVSEKFVTLNKDEKLSSNRLGFGEKTDVAVYYTKTGEKVFESTSINTNISLNKDSKSRDLELKEDVWLESRYGYRVRPEVTSKAHDIDFAGMSSKLLNKENEEDKNETLDEQLVSYDSLENAPLGFKDFPPKQLTAKEILQDAFLRMLEQLEESGENMDDVTFSIRIGKDEE